jgi:hypothetical protein
MSRYMIICRLRWPAFLLLTGIIALLDQARILSWGRAWPLYLILWGVLALAERATLATEPPPASNSPYGAGYPTGYPAGYSAGYAGQPGAYAPAAQAAPTAPAASYTPVSTGIVPVSTGLDVHSDAHNRDTEEEVR